MGWRGNLRAYAAGLAAAGVQDPQELAGKMFETAQALPSELHTDPGAHRLLRTLKGRGLALGVISNHYGALEDHLRNLGLNMYWDVVLDSGKETLCMWEMNRGQTSVGPLAQGWTRF